MTSFSPTRVKWRRWVKPSGNLPFNSTLKVNINFTYIRFNRWTTHNENTIKCPDQTLQYNYHLYWIQRRTVVYHVCKVNTSRIVTICSLVQPLFNLNLYSVVKPLGGAQLYGLDGIVDIITAVSNREVFKQFWITVLDQNWTSVGS